MNFSEYIIYVDESGDPNMVSFNKTYPMFVLAFCIFKKTDYVGKIVPQIQALKFRWFGHDSIILHERELRKGKSPFDRLGGHVGHQKFLSEVSDIVKNAPMTVIATTINKERLKARYSNPTNPYYHALSFCMANTIKFLMASESLDRKVHVIFEARGRQEDNALELEFRRICDLRELIRSNNCFDIRFVNKRANSSGLQIADLIARPIGRHALDPCQKNEAFKIISKKLYSEPNGNYDGIGLKTFP